MKSLRLQINIILGILLIYISIISINCIFEKSPTTKAISIGLMILSLIFIKKSELILEKSAQTLFIITFILITLSLFT